MKLSRRGMLGLFGAMAAPVAVAEAKAEPPKQTFVKGMVVPRFHFAVDHGHSHNYSAHTHSFMPAQIVTTDYEIFDGRKFVPFNSADGQQVVRDLSI